MSPKSDNRVAIQLPTKNLTENSTDNPTELVEEKYYKKGSIFRVYKGILFKNEFQRIFDGIYGW